MRPFERSVDSSCLAKAKCSGLFPVIGFCGVNIFILLKWKVYEKVWVFSQRIWIFKGEFRVAVCTIVIDNLDSQRVKGVNCK